MAEDLMIEWDDDSQGWRGDGGPSGPAGLATVELPDGVDVDVDVAEPTQVIGVWVPDVEEAAEVERIVASATADRISLARLALAEDVLDGFQATALAVTLATVDRALASEAFGAILGPMEIARRIAHAIDVVHGNADDLFEVRRPRLVAEALRDLQDQVGPDASLDALIEALLEAERDQHDTADDDRRIAAAAPMLLDAALERASGRVPVSRLLDIVDLEALPDGLRPEQVAARAATDSEIEIRVGVAVQSKPWWVRVHRVDEIIAVSPLLADGSDRGLARLLVPPDDLHRVEVDIVSRPDDRRPSSTAIAIDRAVRKGRGAARFERTEQYADAERDWRECARGWEAAPDTTRMRAALERSRNSFPQGTAQNPTRGPLLSDLVDE